MSINQLWTGAIALAKNSGIDLIAAADLTAAREFVTETGSKAAAAYPRGISLGLRLSNSIMNGIDRRDPDLMAAYDKHYTIVNSALDHCAFLVAKHLERGGYTAFPVPASQSLPPDKLHSHISHKLVAHLAGLGWIGKSCLLITPEFGPRVRWTTVLTDAPLPAKKNLTEPQCGNCRACVDSCPANAFTNRKFAPGEKRESRFNPNLCQEYTAAYEKQMALSHANISTVCGLCVSVCPFGQKTRRKQGSESKY